MSMDQRSMVVARANRRLITRTFRDRGGSVEALRLLGWLLPLSLEWFVTLWLPGSLDWAVSRPLEAPALKDVPVRPRELFWGGIGTTSSRLVPLLLEKGMSMV